MTKDELELAENCYGYGRWDAPYWFIGLEEGMAPWENGDYAKRADAFRKLNRDGLCDCRKFHEEIHEQRFFNDAPTLQPTWRYLILLLLAFEGKPTEGETLDRLQKDYQLKRWGNEDEETGGTCVIELSGLPSNDTEATNKRPLDLRKQLEEIRPCRIEHIKKMLDLYKPKFAVTYGTTMRKQWLRIAGVQLERDIPQKTGEITFLLALHPRARYRNKDRYWIDLGKSLKAELDRT
jgi:uracil-DNA glycosylase